jgi:hypothetical protein
LRDEVKVSRARNAVMKNSKEYSKKIQKLYRSLKARYPKVQNPLYDEPLDAVVYGIISESACQREAEAAFKRINENFVDLNDLRVSLTEEVVEALGSDTPATRNTASLLVGALRFIFDKYNVVSLELLKKMGKRPARQVLEKMGFASSFVVDYCMLTSLRGHAIPLTKKMLEYLRSNRLVDPEADEREIEGFLSRQISAKNAYEFYALLRRASELVGRRTRKKTETKKKTTRGKKAKKAGKNVKEKSKKSKKRRKKKG